MIPRCNIGKGVTGAVRYALSEGKDEDGNYREIPKAAHSRVAWLGGTGLGFEVETAADADLARRVMEFTALNQKSRTRLCEKDCLFLSLAWRPGETPTREQMEEAAHGALAALGMANARALFVAHNDEAYAHIHIVASKINPETGRAYDLKGNFLSLSKWAQAYERDFSGGVICTRREENNLMRDAIAKRDPAAVLELMTQQRPTFKGRDLERVLFKQIKGEFDRAQFAETVLADAVKLADQAKGRTTRYTTRAVLEAEGQVLRAAEALGRADRHGVRPEAQQAILARAEFAGMSREQAAAFRHATRAGGLALIDGQAGTGKSFVITAIRQAYEARGDRVIGLAPTNAVAGDMRDSGFAHAATIHSELFKLNNGRAAWTDKTVVILDEAAMIDTKLMAQLTGRAKVAGAKLILVGDDRQLSSIDRGGMFGVLKDRHGAAELSEVRRQSKNDEKRAAEHMAEGNFHAALATYDQKGAIHWTHSQEAAREALVRQWAKDSAADPSKSRFVFAYTNADVDRLNGDLRAVRKERGELGEDHFFQTKHGAGAFAERDRIQLTGTDKVKGLVNGAGGTIERIEGDRIAVRLDGRGEKRVEFDAVGFQDFRHGYAGTIYKGQGRTLDQTYLYHSEHWRSAASYVALTRHRDKAELFVARDTAPDVKQLARQMARVDDRRAASAFHESGLAPAATEPPVPTPAATAEIKDMSKYQPLEDAARQAQAARDARAADPGGLDALAKENADTLARQADTMAKQEKARLAFEAEQKRLAEEGREIAAKEKKRQQERADAAEGEVRSAGDRYRIALGQHYDVKDPYGSLARASMAEYGGFVRDREKLTQQIAAEKDADARRGLELRKEIEAHDYMKLTSDRIAANSRVITGRRDSEEGVLMRERAEKHGAEALRLRRELREQAAEREARNASPSGTQPSMARPDQERPGAAASPSKAREETPAKGEVNDAKAEAKAKDEKVSREANERADAAAQNPGGRGGGRPGR